MGIVAVVFIGLVIYGIIIAIKSSAEEKEKLSRMTDKEKFNYYKAQQERTDKAKYNNLMYTCPMCGSKKVKTISTANRDVSIAIFGMASSKIGKCYECDNCKYKW